MRISASQERGNYPDFGSVVSSNAGEYGKGLPLEQAKEFIDNIDLTLVIERLVKVDGGWTKKEALEAAEQYRRFLYLKKKYANHHKFPPSYDIDEVWHAHVLHTKDYIDCCHQLYGCYLHHTPHMAQEASSIEELEKMFATTQALYSKEYGEYLYAVKRTGIIKLVIMGVEKLKQIFK